MKRYTEGVLVGAQDGLSVLLLINHFIKSQGYMVEHKKLYQYNMSTILMENNGRASISHRKKRIK